MNDSHNEWICSRGPATSLLVVTPSASLQLDPANGLSGTQALRISGRLQLEVTRWHESIRRQAPIAQDSTGVDLLLRAEGD